MEYSRNFVDNIRASEFNERAKGIADWIEENKDKEEWAKDPNAYEMTNVFLFAGKYASEGKDVNLETIERIWSLRKGDFERCGIQANNFIYQICEQSYKSAMSKRALVTDENSHSALREMARIGLYLMQQKREKGQDIDYNNFGELMNLIENSKSLKQGYPILHGELKFENNLNILYRIQRIHLNEQSREELDDMYNEYKNMQQRENRGNQPPNDEGR